MAKKKATPPPPPATVGAKVRVARLAAGLTQAQLAERAGLHSQSISDLERDRWDITVGTLMRLAAAIGLPAAELLPDAPGATGS